MADVEPGISDATIVSQLTWQFLSDAIPHENLVCFALTRRFTSGTVLYEAVKRPMNATVTSDLSFATLKPPLLLPSDLLALLGIAI